MTNQNQNQNQNQNELSEKLKAYLEDCCSDLYKFYRQFVIGNNSHNYPAKHLKILSRKLMDLCVNNGRLCISMPPQHGKSSMVTLAFPLWLIWQDPNFQILIVNKTGELSQTFGIQLRELFRRYENFSNIYLSDAKQSSTYLMFQNKDGELYKGSIRLVGADGNITGNPVDYIIIDDPYEGFKDITPTQLQQKIDWFNIIIEQRLRPTSRLIICHTRWSENDIQGYLLRNQAERYEFISFPALDDEGNALWSEVYSPEFLENKRSSMGDREFASVYQQKPLDQTSDFLAIDSIRLNQTDLGDYRFSVRAWDIASGEAKDNDYTAGVRMHKVNNKCYVIDDLVYGHFGGNNLRVIQKTAHNDGVNTRVMIETGVAGAGELLYKEWHRQLKGFYVKRAMPINSKIDRATPLQNAILDNKIIVNLEDVDLRDNLMNEFKSFPEGLHDDIVDAASYAYNYLKDKPVNLDDIPVYIDNLWN